VARTGELSRDLVPYLRQALAAPALDLDGAPEPLGGGFDTEIHAYRLRGAPPDAPSAFRSSRARWAWAACWPSPRRGCTRSTRARCAAGVVRRGAPGAPSPGALDRSPYAARLLARATRVTGLRLSLP
jgi:hypothetical protein